MNELLIYFLKVMAVHGLCYLTYRAFFRETGRHVGNRTYLLVSLILAFFIPLLQWPSSASPVLAEIPATAWFAESNSGFYEMELIPTDYMDAFSWWSLLPWLYIGISAFLLFRAGVYLLAMRSLKKKSEPFKREGFTLFKTSQPRPFSFFSNVFIPKSLFGSKAFDQVLAHECVHVRLVHSMDRLMLDFVVSLFWFNPFIYLYRNALIEIHEYQADEGVIRRFQDPVGYQEVLFSQLQTSRYSGLVSHFNVEMIKKRIVMMNKPKKKTGWIYAITAPVTLMIVFAFSGKEAVQPIQQVGKELTSIVGPLGDFEPLERMLIQKDEYPSILPLKETEDVRVTSGFGTRFDPIDKEEKLHKGIDFATPIGNPVIATADGVIQNAGTDGRHGKRIVIKHGHTYVTSYSHLSELEVKEGQKVSKGEQIGLSGNTGASTAPHLHYEVMKNDEYVNPSDYIKDFTFKRKATSYQKERVEKQQEIVRKEAAKAAERAEMTQQAQLREKEKQMVTEKLALEAREREKQATMKRLEVQELARESEKSRQEELKKINKEKNKGKNKVKDKDKKD
ncbi:MAG: hypothetical protein Tsb0034_12070 [Ekhidna sp.]